MNKIYKVMYSKVKQCCVVVSEIAKSHGRHTKSSVAKSSAALTAGVLIALGSFSFVGMPVAQAADGDTGESNLRNNDFVGANDHYWYYDDKANKWIEETYSDWLIKHRNRKDLPNINGAGAKGTGSIAAGLYAQAGMQSVTIGNRNAGASRGSVFIGEHSGYNDGNNNISKGETNHYVTSVGFQSDATGWGSIAIGSNALAENSETNRTITDEDLTREANTTNNKNDDVYGIKTNPTIKGASVALGYSAHSKDGNIAIGAYSDATSTDKNDSYVSVGNANLKRRITNVADGASVSDVATVGQLQALSKELGGYKAGFGIQIDPESTDKTKNTISVKHNLGTGYADTDATGLILGGSLQNRDVAKEYGTATASSVIVGAQNALASNDNSVVVGGLDNVASGANSTVVGGDNNKASGNQSAVFGGRDNTASGIASTAGGGIMNVANGWQSTAIGGFSNYALGIGSTSVGGYGKDYATGHNSSVNGNYSVGIAGGSTGKDANYSLAAGRQAVVTTENGTAIGYQATADEANTIAFGHDAGDVSGYTIKWKQLPPNQINADGTTNDYTQAPESVTENKYTKAAYNRLVKVADGQDDHDVVVMEQLNNAKNDLKVNAGWGINVNDVTTKNDGKETTTKNVISLNRNLGTNYGNTYDGEIYGGKGKVTFEADGENSLILGGGAINNSFEGKDNDFSYGAHAKDSVLVGGMNNSIEKQSEGAIIVGGTYNTASSANQVQYTGKNTIIVGGTRNKAEGNGALLIGGSDNQALSTGEVQQTGEDTIIIGGSSNKAEGDGSVLIGGSNNESLGLNTTTIGGWHNKNEGWISSIWGGTYNQITGIAQAAGIFGGNENKISNAGSFASILGGEKNTVEDTFGVVVGGSANKSSNMYSSVFGGTNNTASGAGSSVSGGFGNLTSGNYAYAAGGTQNYVTGMEASSLGGIYSSVNGRFSTGVAGGSTGQEAFLSLAGGYQSVVADGGAEKTYLTGADAIKVLEDMYSGKKLPGYYMQDPSVETGPENPGRLIHYDKFSTALGYQATANKPGTIAFGHDAGDESGYTYEWETLTDEKGNPKQNEIDGTTNDYTKAPKSIKKNEPYTSAYYNRLVKVADGIDDHDVVVMEQLKQYAEKDASNLGNNIKVYKTDENGNVQLDENKKPVKDEAATTTAQKKSKDDWGKALGADPFTAGTATTATNASTSDQLVTGKTLYNYDAPVAETGKKLNYVSANNTTGQNLLNLDRQVKTNTDTLSDVNSRSVKYDTKTENGKTVVDNTKITLAGEGGTTITNLKDGVNANDAATMGQLNAKISGVTYKAGDGIKYDTDAENNKTISVNKGDGLKFTEDHKLAVNTGKHLSVNTDGQIEVGDNGAVAENDGNLVTGDTVYKALNGGMTKMIIGTPGKDGKDGKDGTPGTIGLVGPAGTNGKDGAVDITIQKGEDGKDGTKGAKGVDGKDGINRIVYEDKNGKHQVATMEDGLKFAGDDGQKEATKAIAKKLNNTVDIIGGADSTKLTANNIGVNNVDGKLKIQLAQELTGITSISGSTGSNGAKITLDTNDQNISVNGGKITDVASGLSTNDGSYNANDAHNAANISDVNSMISKAVTDAKGETQKDLDKKANVDASNIGTNLKGANGKTAATEAEQKANLDKWGKAIGTGEVKDGSNQLVTGNTVYNAVKDKADKSYVDTQLSTKANTDGSNIDADEFSKKVAIGNINDSDERAVSGKTVNEAIQTINGNIDGKANKNLDNIDNAGKNVIKDQARAAVTIDNKGLNTNVVATQDDKNHTTTYTINVEGNGKVAAKDTGLISGDTIYNELRPATDGSYIKQTNTTAQNLTSLDTQVRATHDLINSDGKTIKIGGSDAATKIDVNGKDGKGRVITGVVSDANDPNSAANVGYVNGLTAANTQQIYRDMNNAYGRLNDNINKAAAGSNALAALHPLDYDPDDKADFAVGYGHYRNANAAAVGAFYHPNENTMVNVGVSLGNGDPGFNAGVSFKVGRGGAGREAMSKTEMAKVINSQSKEIDALKKDNADKDKRIDALEQKMAEILAKLDKNGK